MSPFPCWSRICKSLRSKRMREAVGWLKIVDGTALGSFPFAELCQLLDLVLIDERFDDLF